MRLAFGEIATPFISSCFAKSSATSGEELILFKLAMIGSLDYCYCLLELPLSSLLLISQSREFPTFDLKRLNLSVIWFIY